MIDHYSFDLFPLTSERWQDLESHFGEHSAYAGCCIHMSCYNMGVVLFRDLGGTHV
jgi:hypothetical protein